ncbi:hypothetical protein NOF04DRAFT_5820 [Fusarium oxysporum II5]|uniref:Uncharacterized protein n=3 Tax=Fusarium oxysporum species complex TaxID=171631 RepID=N1RYF2_FUSC4|nr:uncharacterized protein FOIG_09101 [Fusarium odoratissimum NRRL 54006]EMT70446.1 hypothetical protein FOC4_g10008896 [Fusarium odoratissimum]EXL99237.1 hypothetical protein FOIG_09101 [Fusarium odoratissimum NRRL 54006]KAK2130456.1 hypothetical protein NOF04DRAFT_5820 [Fusarium oxysporum II5]TXC01447.1 hypothetical protein FocTR4_00009387 [Fusarium oxysporum f. sp. cubense]
MASTCLSRLLLIFMVVGLVQVLAQPINVVERSPCYKWKTQEHKTERKHIQYGSKEPTVVHNNITVNFEDEEGPKDKSHSKGSESETTRTEYPKEGSSKHYKHLFKTDKYKDPEDYQDKHSKLDDKHYSIKPAEEKEAKKKKKPSIWPYYAELLLDKTENKKPKSEAQMRKDSEDSTDKHSKLDGKYYSRKPAEEKAAHADEKSNTMSVPSHPREVPSKHVESSNHMDYKQNASDSKKRILTPGMKKMSGRLRMIKQAQKKDLDG